MKSYTHITLIERICLQVLFNKGMSIRKIAEEFDRSPSSLSRELKRNWSKKKNRYNAVRAQNLYNHRRKRCKRKTLIQCDKQLYEAVLERLKKFWPPETIAAVLKEMGFNISTGTIYRAVRKGQFEGIKPTTHLRRKNKRKRKKGVKRATIKPEKSIHDRPEEANEKSRPGDFEGDTVCGAKNKSCIVTQVDRMTKLLTAAISLDHRAESVRAATKRAFELMELPLPIETITLDNGSEFADYKGIESDLDTEIYFADPHSPWQRGLNENTNDIIRFFFPKGTDFSKVSEEELQDVVHLINTRPRKCLGYLSPLDFASMVLHLT